MLETCVPGVFMLERGREARKGMRRLIAVVAVLGLLLVACSSDPTTSEEYQELEQQLADTEQSLADVTAERDSLAATAGESSARYEKSLATQEAVDDILNNPESYGSEEEVVELLATYATEDAWMDDDVFGAVPIKNAWYYTLYGGTMDSEIDNYYRWLSDDGSQGGFLWLWHGTNQAGNPFELPGINLDEYDENGLLAYSYVVYPYPDDYVREAVEGSGTAQGADEVSSEEIFVLGADDLCEWVTEEEIAQAASDAFDSAGVAWEGTATLVERGNTDWDCDWLLAGAGNAEGITDGEVLVDIRSDVGVDPEEIIEYVEGEPWTGGYLSDYPGLDDDILIAPGAFGSVGFVMSDSGDALAVMLYSDEIDQTTPEPFVIVANRILDEMNWNS